MYRVFIVEDDREIARSVSGLLAAWDMEVRCAKNFRGVMAEFSEVSPHIVLLDIALPFYNGYHWCSEMRKVSKVPILFISSSSDNMNMVMAMNMGADDFVTKPFDGDVLLAKVQALLRRTYDFAQSVPVLEHRGAMLNTGSGDFFFEGQQIDLTKNEYRILFVLMSSKGQVVSREKLMEDLWKSDDFVDENTLTVNVNRLRKKLSAAGLDDFIRTKFGVGYLID